MKDHENCIWNAGTRKPLHQCLHLEFLRTSRPVYHEAVLKPFSINEFQSTAIYWGGSNALLYLTNASVPTQVRAIKRLRLISLDNEFMRRDAVRQLKGLEHLNVEMILSDKLSWRLKEFRQKYGVNALRELSLRTLRFTIEVKSDSVQLRDTDIETLITWQEKLEDELLDRT